MKKYIYLVSVAFVASVTRSGAGTAEDPFTLGVSTGGITQNELADDAVTLAKVADGTTAGGMNPTLETVWGVGYKLGD